MPASVNRNAVTVVDEPAVDGGRGRRGCIAPHRPALAGTLPGLRRTRPAVARSLRRLREVAAVESPRLPALRDAVAVAVAVAGIPRRRRGRGLRRLPATPAAAGAGARRLRLRPSARSPAAALQVPRRPGGRTPAGAARARCLRWPATGQTRCSPFPCTGRACARAVTTRRWSWRGRWRARCAFRCATMRCSRLRATAPQSRLDAPQRRRNLRDAFSIAEGAKALPAHVVLVDDVMTTGATLHAAAKTLRRAGVERIDAWICARTS